jgi:hypothetical protein
MKPERWKRLEELFHRALDREPLEQAAFLAVECAGDEAMRREVESLLGFHNCDERSLDASDLQTVLIEAAKLAPRWNEQLAALHARELGRGNHNRATLAVARKLVAYLMAVDKSGKPFQVRTRRLKRVHDHYLRGRCPLPTHSSEQSRESFAVHTGKNVWACQSASCRKARQGRVGANILDLGLAGRVLDSRGGTATGGMGRLPERQINGF